MRTESWALKVGEADAVGRRQRIGRCVAGDSQAWRDLLAEVRPLVQAIAREEFGLGPEDREDVSQQVAVKLYEHLADLRVPAAFPQWLRCLTRRVIVDFLRQRRETTSLDELAETGGVAGGEPEGEPAWVDQALLRVDLRRALDHLPARYRVPIQLHYLRDTPQEELGRALGLPRNTVASQIHRGLGQLRRSLFSLEGR